MKKLMVAACAIAFAAVSQAAMIDWGLEAESFTMSDDSAAAGVTVSLVQFASESAVQTAWNDLAAGKTTIADYDVIDTGITGSGKKDTGAIDPESKIGIESGKLVEGARAYYALFVEDGDQFLLSNASLAMAYDPDGDIETEGMAALFDGGYFDMGETQQLGSWSTVESVPEPTSGLLLLLGVASLALKRKRA